MLSRVWNVFLFQLKQALCSPRIVLIFVLIAIFIFSNVQPVSAFANDVDIDVAPWAFPHITNDYICQLVIMAAVILLFCDAPFENGTHPYVVSRAGNTAWVGGICLYIVAISFLYVLSIFAVSIVALIPHINFGLGWGKVLGTLAKTSAGSQYGMSISFSDYIIGAYTPINATFTAFLLEWACCVWIGLVIYVLNNASNSLIGCFVAMAFILLDITIWNEWTYVFFRISPVTMAQLAAISRSESLYGLSKSYAIGFFSISIAIFISVSILEPIIKRQIVSRKKGGICPMSNILSVQNVSKIYGQQTVLNSVSMRCEAGKIYGLVGRNGSGKTVLLKCICGLTQPTDGAVFVWDKQIGKDSDFPDNVGFIIEHPGFLLNESGFSNLKHLASIQRKVGVERIRECMELVGLDPDLKKRVGKYSLGMRQRLGIAQAIMEKPDLLILDEPMNGLDNQGVEQIRSVLKNMSNDGTTILLASHSKEDISFLCDEVFQMDAGVLSEKRD